MKKKINIDFDAPVTIVFTLLSILLFVFNTFIFKGKLNQILLSPTTASGSMPFIASNAISYIRLAMFSFGSVSWEILLTNILFILLLGPAMEERYGSAIIGIMMLVSAVFSGVLNACFCKNSIQGCTSIIFMMIFLNSFMSFSKKKIPFSFVLIFILFIVREIISKNTNGAIGIIIGIAGGLCGSLFAFLASPKAKAARKNSEGGLLNKAERLAQIDSESPRFKENKKAKKSSDSEDDSTVIGTLEF